MQELYHKLSHFSLKDALIIENSDRQFIALQNLINNTNSKAEILTLTLINSLICYQLSGKWEDYWEEFSLYFLWKDLKKEDIIEKLIIFIKQSKNNKRFVEVKVKRLEKIRNFLDIFIIKQEYFYKNMDLLAFELKGIMKQKITDKTIVFAVKMFSYVARNIFDFNYFPINIMIPIDSRLEKIFDKYKWDYTNISIFYSDLSKKLKIPLLHLDAILWVNYEEIIS